MWTWQINSISKKNDNLSFTLNYQVTDGSTVIVRPPILLSATPPDDIKSASIRVCQNDVTQLNKADAQKAATIAVDVANLVGVAADVIAAVEAEKPKPDPPAPEELARRAFQQLLTDYRVSLGCESFGVKPPSPSADILANIQATYLPEYASMMAASRF